MEFDPRAITIRLNAIGNAMDELNNNVRNISKKNIDKTMQNCDILLHLIDIFWEYYSLNARFFPEEIYKKFQGSLVELLVDIYVGLSAFQNAVLSPTIAISLIKKYNESFQITQEQVCLCNDMVSATETDYHHKLDPRIREDRITALLEEFNSNVGDCPYNTPETKSKCLLEPRVVKVIDCEGKCFVNGLCCQMISQVSEIKS
ncbi:MAG: hypothetical protein ACW963_04455 [Candidatus Sifarchaeia archaeon]